MNKPINSDVIIAIVLKALSNGEFTITNDMINQYKDECVLVHTDRENKVINLKVIKSGD